MSSDPTRPFGSDTLTVPIYLAKGDGTDDPGFQRWKRDHPDWFVAGHWVPRSRVPQRRGAEGDAAASRGRNTSYDPRMLSAEALLESINPRSLDPSTLSVADFLHTAAQEKDEAARSPSRAADRSEPTPELHAGPSSLALQRTSGIHNSDRSSIGSEYAIEAQASAPVPLPPPSTLGSPTVSDENSRNLETVAAAVGRDVRYCELPSGQVVPYIDLGNGYAAIPLDTDGQSSGATGFAAGRLMTETGMPTVDKPGGIAAGGASGPVTSPASQILRDLTENARLSVLRPLSGTTSVGGSIGRALPVLGVLESFISFLNSSSAYLDAPLCKPLA